MVPGEPATSIECPAAVRRPGGDIPHHGPLERLATRSISLATADLAEAEPQQVEADHLCYQYDGLVRALTHRREALSLMRHLEGRLDLADGAAALAQRPVVLISRPGQPVEDQTGGSGTRPTAGPGLRFEIRCYLATEGAPDAEQ